jgi:hypothetical protein
MIFSYGRGLDESRQSHYSSLVCKLSSCAPSTCGRSISWIPKSLPCWPTSSSDWTYLEGFYHQAWQIYWVATQAYLSSLFSWALILHGPFREWSTHLWLLPNHPLAWTLSYPPKSWGWWWLVHYDESFVVASELALHHLLKNLHHHK